MLTQEALSICQFVSTVVSLAAAREVHLELGSDFTEFKKSIEAQPLRHPLQRHFDPARSNLKDEQGFWITGRDNRGRLVHTQAMRLMDLKGDSLASFLALHHGEFVRGGYDLDLSRSHYRPGPASHRISGLVCYHGELWLHDHHRGAGMTALVARLALALALLQWSPDFVFGFMYQMAACKGLASREGYMHEEPGSTYWASLGKHSDLETWTVWMAREDLRFLVSLPPAPLFEQLEIARQAKLMPLNGTGQQC
ncbi:hypothetical protein ACTL6U_18300 [Rhodovibrionaceae bacterium A322]